MPKSRSRFCPPTPIEILLLGNGVNSEEKKQVVASPSRIYAHSTSRAANFARAHSLWIMMIETGRIVIAAFALKNAESPP